MLRVFMSKQKTSTRAAIRPPIRSVVGCMVAIGILILGQRLWHLRGTVTQYQQYWTASHGTSGGLRYVALGDSAAQGVGLRVLSTGMSA